MSGEEMTVRLLKRQLRREIQRSLKQLTDSEVIEESNRCATRLFQLPQFNQSRNVSIYLSMPSGELQTPSILEKAFQSGKRVFVPFIDGKIMQMVETSSLEELKTFRPNSWGIPEPTSIEGRAIAPQDDRLDLIVVPGVAFDQAMNRIGHGKGYYDHFIQRCYEHAKKTGNQPPTLVGLALKAQLLGEGTIPMTDTDCKMDFVIADGEIYEGKYSHSIRQI